MQTLLSGDDPTTFSIPAVTLDRVLDFRLLQSLGERLRGIYGLEKEPLPACLAELVERLVRREQTTEEAGD